jgi:hypothetical protein
MLARSPGDHRCPSRRNLDDVASLEQQRRTAMVTVGEDGLPKVARVAVVLIDGQLWSSGREDRIRTPRPAAVPHDAGHDRRPVARTVMIAACACASG